jgi:hypothetical protein
VSSRKREETESERGGEDDSVKSQVKWGDDYEE